METKVSSAKIWVNHLNLEIHGTCHSVTFYLKKKKEEKHNFSAHSNRWMDDFYIIYPQVPHNRKEASTTMMCMNSMQTCNSVT